MFKNMSNRTGYNTHVDSNAYPQGHTELFEAPSLDTHNKEKITSVVIICPSSIYSIVPDSCDLVFYT
jgi:hypothetical protein